MTGPSNIFLRFKTSDDSSIQNDSYLVLKTALFGSKIYWLIMKILTSLIRNFKQTLFSNAESIVES